MDRTDDDRATRQSFTEPPPEGATIRFGFRFPHSGDKEFTGVVRGKGIWSTTGPVKLTRLASDRLLWWEAVPA